MGLPKVSGVVAALLTCATFLASVTLAAPVDSTATREIGRKDAWVRRHFGVDPGQGQPFFSMIYGGRPSATLLPSWSRQTRQNKIDDQRTEHILSWTDPRSGLIVRCRAVEYHDFPTVEWTLLLKNPGAEPTPLVEQIEALDIAMKRALPGEFVLHHQTGDNCSAHS